MVQFGVYRLVVGAVGTPEPTGSTGSGAVLSRPDFFSRFLMLLSNFLALRVRAARLGISFWVSVLAPSLTDFFLTP